MNIAAYDPQIRFDIHNNMLLEFRVDGEDKGSVRRYMNTLKGGERHAVEVKQRQKRRSLDANAYCWKLCTDIAAVIRSTKEEVYRSAIKAVGPYTQTRIYEGEIEIFSHMWAAHGTGWVIDVMDYCELEGHKLVFAYHGSSTYDKKQMSQLIDYLIDECKELDIETLPPSKLALIKEGWPNEKQAV